MVKNLVIVESPAKAKTIEKFLGEDFHVTSSMGHIRDLKSKDISIDFDKNYKPIYEVPADKKKLVAELKKQVKNSETVWLASDEDREGEAIAWHLADELKLDPSTTKRIVFPEITKNVILEAIKNPRTIDFSLVDAQQARRVLDRIVGFELSPILWRKIMPSLSAGRVQSVGVRLIVEREREIVNFKPEADYRVTAIFKTDKNEEVKAVLDTRFKTKKEAVDFLEKCKNGTFEVTDISTKPTKRSPAAPFTTSTLQQEASRKLGYSVSQTMRIAQHLYESGFITYMRTDSVNLSSLAINSAKEEIKNFAGEEYSKVRQYKTKTPGAQEAHEAIRPTYLSNHSIEGTSQEKHLYELIWKRTIASQMADAQLEKTVVTIDIKGSEYKFIASGEVLLFDGFLKVYMESRDDEDDDESSAKLPKMKSGDVLNYNFIACTEKFSQHPPRYNEASFIKKMEELEVGRPSTYAPTITTIINRGYVEKKDKEGEKRSYNEIRLEKNNIVDETKTEIVGAEKNKLFPTDIGSVVTNYLLDNFNSIVDYNFTASVERELDRIAEGNVEWEKVIDNFYKDFHPMIDDAIKQRGEHKVGERILGTDPKSGRPVSVKIGRYGAVAQIGTSADEEKPLFASLAKNQSIETVSLEEVLELFKLPRLVGEYEGKEIKSNVGRFGPYIAFSGTFVSIPKGNDPMSITLEEAISLIEAKRSAEQNRVFKTFAEDADMQLLNGRYGVYLFSNNTNYKLPKGCNPAELTYDDCKKIIAETPEHKTRARRSSK